MDLPNMLNHFIRKKKKKKRVIWIGKTQVFFLKIPKIRVIFMKDYIYKR